MHDLRETDPSALAVIHVYPSIFTMAGIAHAIGAASKIMSSWSQNVRDKEFLVEMRLRNHEPEGPKRDKSIQATDAIDADADAED